VAPPAALAGRLALLKGGAIVEENPPRALLLAACDLSYLIVAHVRRYWSVDGGPLPRPTLASWGNAETVARTAELLNAVERGRKGNHPGPVIEWQLRELVTEWDTLNINAATSTLRCAWFENPPPPGAEALAQHFVRAGWQGWSNAVFVECGALVVSVEKLIHGVRQGNVPESFNGLDLEAMSNASEALQRLVTFVPTDLQTDILHVLDGKAMTADKLEAAAHVSRHTLYGGKTNRGGLNELVELGIVLNDRKVGGYFRPDAPPKAH
jgi:hypothetical protein